MNLILLKPNDFIAENLVEIFDFRFAHILSILKSQVGDNIKAGLINSKIGFGKILEISGKSIKLQVIFDKDPPAPNPKILFCALPRPKVFRRVLYNAVCFGVKQIHFFHSYKVEKSYWQSPFLTEDSVNKIIDDALMQAVDTVLPKIYFHRRFLPFAEDVFAAFAKENPCLIFHPSENKNVKNMPIQKKGLIIGPEGGFTDYEVEVFCKFGATLQSLGQRILRVEQAVCTVL